MTIRERGPMTVAAFMDLALYDPHVGYYARAARRSGRAGDFYQRRRRSAVRRAALKSQIAEMLRTFWVTSRNVLGSVGADLRVGTFDLVEAGAERRPARRRYRSRAAKRRDPALLRRAAAAPRRGQRRGAPRTAAQRLADVADRLASSVAVSCRSRSRACSSPTNCWMRCRCIRSSCARTGCGRCTSVARPSRPATRRRL